MRDFADTVRCVAVVPTLRRDPDSLIDLRAELISAGLDPYLVATGRSLDEQLTALAVPHESPRNNPGFGAAITHGASAAEQWDWLYVINDDLEFDSNELSQVRVELISAYPSAPCLALLDPEPMRRIPGRLATWRNVALLPRITRRPAHTGAGYKSFSMVAINRSAWDQLKGFNLDLTYTFEDADMTARAIEAGMVVLDRPLLSLVHEKSGTSRSMVADVLPVSADSALRYLMARGVNKRWAKTTVLSALVARVPGAMIRPHRKNHLLGISRSIRILIRNDKPRLPEWSSS